VRPYVLAILIGAIAGCLVAIVLPHEAPLWLRIILTDAIGLPSWYYLDRLDRRPNAPKGKR